jgi:hypothetical protein
MRMVWQFLLLGVMCAMSSWTSAQPACDIGQRISFLQGQVGCLTDYPFSQASPSGYSQTVEQLTRSPVLYSLTLSGRQGDTCPAVVEFSREVGRQIDPMQTRLREGIALASCASSLSRKTISKDCSCELVLSDGRSLLTKEEFDNRYARKEPPTQAPSPAQVHAIVQAALKSVSGVETAQPAPVEAETAQPPPIEAPTSPPPPVQALASPPPSDELIQALQKRVAELEASRIAPAGSTARQASRLSARALVIGNSRYTSFGRLANPQRDATAIAAKLRSFGIPVDLLLDAQRDDLIHALNEHSRQAAGKDISIFYYAGHGVQVEGTNYLIPVNMRASGISSGYVKLAGISLNAALDYLPAKTRIVFLDACRDNPASRTLVSTRGAATSGLAPVNLAGGTLLSYATRDGETADDGTGQHSPYTTALLQHLDSPVDISLVLRQVRQTVLQLTSGRQEPWEYGSLIGDQIVLPLLSR